MHGQIQPSQTQPSQTQPSQTQPSQTQSNQPRPTIASSRSMQVQREIQNFLQALDSYPARVAREPRLSFHQHLCSVFAAARDHRRDSRADRP
jgi:hypothetical protein